MPDPGWATGGRPAADWYPDPHGGGGVRWWDGDRWTDDVRDAHPSGPVGGPRAPGPGEPPDEVSAAMHLPRLHVQQSAVRSPTEPLYVVGDPWGRPIAHVWERPFLSGARQRKAATLDGMTPGGRGLFRITRDRAIYDPVHHAANVPPPKPGSWVVFDGDGAPIAVARLQGGRFSQGWVVDVAGRATPMALHGNQVGARGRARPVVLDGHPVAQITLVSRWNAADAYTVDIPGAPHDRPLGVTLLGIGVLYDQIFRETEPSRSHDSGPAVDPSIG